MSDDSATLGDSHGTSTLASRPIGLRILSHPDMSRVGDLGILFAAEACGHVELSRSAPAFSGMDGVERGALETRHVSRAPLHVSRREDGTLLLKLAAGQTVGIDGSILAGDRVLSSQELRSGLVMALGRAVALWLGEVDLKPAPEIDGFVGVSAATLSLRRRLAELAKLDAPVLFVGAAGVGKQAAARALAALSERRTEPFVVVHATHSSSAGGARGLAGVLTGVDAGTLFLDELADLDREAQCELLRALDDNEARARTGRAVEHRTHILVATEVDPESAEAAGRLRRALVDRFPHVLRIPVLRERREDIGLLFATFLRGALSVHGAAERFAPRSVDASAFVPAQLMVAMARANWPGNVRQLRNFAEAYALANHGADEAGLVAWIAEHAPEPAEATTPRSDDRGRRIPPIREALAPLP